MWNTLTVHAPIWLGFFVMGWYLSGGTVQPLEEPDLEVPPVVVVQEITEEEIAYERCGKYNLVYHVEPNGFYNCLRKG